MRLFYAVLPIWTRISRGTRRAFRGPFTVALLFLLSLPPAALAHNPAKVLIVNVNASSPIALNSTVTLEPKLNGTPPLKIQWKRNGVNIFNATDPVYKIDQFSATDGGIYTLHVENEWGSDVSRPIRLTPNIPVLALSDDFLAPTAPGQPVSNLLTSDSGAGRGSNETATRQATLQEPRHAGTVGGASMWATWIPSANGIATVTTLGSDFDTALAVYVSTETPPSLASLREIKSDLDSAGSRASRVVFNAEAGTTYFIAIDGEDGIEAGTFKGKSTVRRGAIVLSWSLLPTQARAAVFPSDFASQNILPGSGLNLNALVGDFGATSTAYRWLRNNQLLAGQESPQLVLPTVTPDLVGKYACEVQQTFNGVTITSKTADIDVQIFRRNVNSDTRVRSEDDFADAANSEFDTPSPSPSPAPQVVPLRNRPGALWGLGLGVSGTQIFNTQDASAELGEPAHCGIPSSRSEWYAIRADDSGILRIDTVGSSFDTVLAAYFDTGQGAGLFDGLVSLACNNDAPDLGKLSRITFPITKGIVYYIAVDGVAGAGGIAQLNYSLSPPLGITRQPASLSATRLSQVTLSVGAVGVGSLRYQWFKNGNPIPNANSDLLALPSIDFADAGQYTVSIQDDLGSVTSAPASLTVHEGPAILSHPQSQSARTGATVFFTVTASGTPAPTYQWLRNGAPLNGETQNSLTLVNVQPTQAGAYSVLVSNPAGATQSSEALLTVGSPPSLDSQPQSVVLVEGQTASFSIAASGEQPIRYQWKRNQIPVDGANGPTLVIPTCNPSHAGAYSVVVSNDSGQTESRTAILTVLSSAESSITASRSDDGVLKLSVKVLPNIFYVIEESDDLQHWEVVQNFNSPDGTFNHFVLLSLQRPGVYFRVRTK